MQKHYNVSEEAMDEWGFWQFEENIKIVNELAEEEEKHRKKEEESSNQSFNPGSYMNKMSGMANKFK